MMSHFIRSPIFQHGSLPRFLHPGIMTGEHSVALPVRLLSRLGYSVEIENPPIIHKDTKKQHFKCMKKATKDSTLLDRKVTCILPVTYLM